MEKFEGDFLKDKYWGDKDFREAAAVSARRTEKKEGKKIPDSPTERIKNYLGRFGEITDREDLMKRDHGISAIEHLIDKKYIIKPEKISDEYIKNVLLGNEAELLGYERGATKDPEVRKFVLNSLEDKIGSPLDIYSIPEDLRKSMENTIVTDQRLRMKQWLEYLTGEEAHHAPTSLRYWAFAEMLKQGDYDPVRGEYNKRTDATVAVFPELDQQALALVFDEIERRRTDKASTLVVGDESRHLELVNLLQAENFGRLYAFMQDHVRSLKLPTERLVVTKGEWKTFPQGSSPTELTDLLQGFQTKWCIAGEGHAASYLESSDVLVYFSEDVEGKNTIPRACIVNNKNLGITEVRGIIFNEEVKQHLDDYITPIVDAKLRDMEGGEKWADKMADMGKLSELHFKYIQGKTFTKEDLSFLYEIDRPIYQSGYGKDPRISEILTGRDQKNDLSRVLDCRPEQVSLTADEALKGDIIFHFHDLDLRSLPSVKNISLPKMVSGSLDLRGLTFAEDFNFPEKVWGDVYLPNLSSARGTKLPAQIGGRLDLERLTSSEDLIFPQSVGKDLEIPRLASAYGLVLPETVGRFLNLHALTVADGLTLPKTVGGDLSLQRLTSVKELVLPENIGGSLHLYHLISAEKLVLPKTLSAGGLYLNNFTSAKGLILPENISGHLKLSSLTSTEGLTLPETVGGDLDLSSITSAEGLTFPKVIGENLNLISLVISKDLTLPETVGANLDLSSITSAEDLILPKTVGGDLNLSSLKLAKNLTLPETVGGNIDLSNLTTSEGISLPKFIGGSLNLELLRVENLTLPETIGGNLNLSNLKGTEGLTLPKYIYGSLNLDSLTYTEGLILPEEIIGGDLYLDKLTTANGLTLPKKVDGYVHLRGLPSYGRGKLRDIYPNLHII